MKQAGRQAMVYRFEPLDLAEGQALVIGDRIEPPGDSLESPRPVHTALPGLDAAIGPPGARVKNPISGTIGPAQHLPRSRDLLWPYLSQLR
jgi:hypothetical protein